MTTRTENLTSQIDGANSIFAVGFPFLTGTQVLTFNGQTFPRGMNVNAELTSTTFQTTFIPEIGDTLSIQYEDFNNEFVQPMQASGRPPGF